MPPIARLLLLVGAGLAALAVVAAVFRSGGDVDVPSAGTGTGPTGPRGRVGARRLPALSVPADFGDDARRVLLDVHGRASGDDAAATEAMGLLAEPSRRKALRALAPRPLELLLPTFEVLLKEPDGDLAGATLRATATLALDGGQASRELLDGSGFVRRSVVPRALSGSAAIREETARLLGFVGGGTAGDRLVLMLADAEPAVTQAAVLALGDIADRERRLPELAPEGLLGLFDRSDDPGVRRACLVTFRRAHRILAAWGVAAREAEALRSPDAATRLVAATNQQAHPSPEAFDGLVAALADPDPRIVEPVADALGLLLDPRAAGALRARRETLSDPAARRAVDSALRRLEALPPEVSPPR